MSAFNNYWLDKEIDFVLKIGQPKDIIPRKKDLTLSSEQLADIIAWLPDANCELIDLLRSEIKCVE